MCALPILFACTQEEPAPIRVESIELDSEELELIEGNSISLVATILPKDAENQNVIWSSSNKAVASVKDGEVTAVSVGEATITAKSEDGGKKATCVVTVNPKHIPVSAISLDKTEVAMNPDDKVMLTATIAPENASNKSVLWSSSDESIATVKDGEVAALKVGEAIITATSEDGGKKATCKVTVNAKPVPVTGVSLNKQKARVFISDELTLTATVAPEDATNKTLVWTTSNALVATVKNGVVKGISVGEADITVKTEDGNHSATCKVSVTEESQTQTKGPLTLDLGTVTSTTATFNGVLDVDMLGEYDMNAGGVGFIYAPVDQPLNIVTSTKVQISEVDAQGKFTHTLTGLKYNSEYHYAIFVYKNTICQYGETQVFETVPIDIELSVKDITQTRATISGRLTLPENDKELEVGVLYSTESDPTIATEGAKKIVVIDIIEADGGFSHRAEGLWFETSHYYRYYVKQGDAYAYGPVQNFKTETVSVDLSVSDITQTTATFNAKIELTEGGIIEVGVLYSKVSSLGVNGGAKRYCLTNVEGNFSHQATKLNHTTTYYYCYYACQNGKYIYGETKTFITSSVSMNLSVSTTQTTATFNGKVDLTGEGVIKVGILYSQGSTLTLWTSGVAKQELTPNSTGKVSHQVKGLQYATTYNYCYYVYQDGRATYGEMKTFTTSPVKVNLSANHITQTTATFDGIVELTEDGLIEVGILYSQGTDLTADASGVVKQRLTDSAGDVTYKAEGLQNATTYNYCYYVCQDGKYTYGETKTFTTSPVEVNLSVNNITQTTATFDGIVELTEKGLIEVGIIYSEKSDFTADASGVVKQSLTDISDDITYKAEGLKFNTTYFYKHYAYQNGKYEYGVPSSFTTLDTKNDISVSGTSNCYVVSQSGLYKIKTVKGNSNESVGDVASAEVLWESFGTDVAPCVGDLVAYAVCSKEGYVGFEIPSDFKEGNAVIAVKDISGNILWSWHIWLTDVPDKITYANNAGIMMDRNLGATSSVPGDVGALGLFYQWGRKDPFLGSPAIYSPTGIAKSTIDWPDSVYPTKTTGTIDYAIANPTTFITHGPNSSGGKWLYGADDSLLWSKEKSIYDPCPEGWRVPDGGPLGIWALAGFPNTNSSYNFDNYSITFDIEYCVPATYYPEAGWFNRGLGNVGTNGRYWSCTSDGSDVCFLNINSGYIDPSGKTNNRQKGFSVRCVKE